MKRKIAEKMNQMKKNKKGFTLIELIVVIAIIGVLAALLVPSMMGYVDNAKKATADANARTAYTAAQAAFTQLSGEGKTPDSTNVEAKALELLGTDFDSSKLSIEVELTGIKSVTYDTAKYPKDSSSETSPSSK